MRRSTCITPVVVPGRQRGDFKFGIERVALINGFEKAAGLIKKPDQGGAHLMRQRAGSDRRPGSASYSHAHRGRDDQTTVQIGRIVVDRVIVARCRLKRGENAGCHSARRGAKHLAHGKVIKGAGRMCLMLGRVKAHVGSEPGVIRSRKRNAKDPLAPRRGLLYNGASVGSLAQLVERFVYTEDVGSSSLSRPTIFLYLLRQDCCLALFAFKNLFALLVVFFLRDRTCIQSRLEIGQFLTQRSWL